MPKTIILPDPVEADVRTITLTYDNGVFAGGLVSVRLAGPDGETETKQIPFQPSDLGAPMRTNLNTLCTQAAAKVRQLLGFT